MIDCMNSCTGNFVSNTYSWIWKFNALQIWLVELPKQLSLVTLGFKTSTLSLLTEGKFFKVILYDIFLNFVHCFIFTFIYYENQMLFINNHLHLFFFVDNMVVPRTHSVVPRQNSNQTTIGRLVLKYLYWWVKHIVRCVLHQ